MKDRGFTLIEIIITIVILGVIGLFSFAFFSNLTRTYAMMGAKRIVHQEAAYALERISRELREAKTVNAVNNVLEFERANPTPNPIRQDSNKYIRFYRSGSDLYRDSASDSGFTTNITQNIVARGVSNFIVSPNGTPLPLNTIITLTISVTRDNETQSYSVDICPKNYNTTSSCNFTGRSFGGCYEDKIN